MSNQDRERIGQGAIKDLFDDKGITEAYRKDHILIRAILSCLNQWKATDTGQLDMSERYFTENYQGPIEQYLTEVVTNAKPHPSETNESFKMLFKRLINDSSSAALFDKIAEKERAQNSCFKVHDNRSYILAIPGTWYDRMVLDTERHIIIPKVVAKYDYKYSNKEQEGPLNSSVNDAWGWQIPSSARLMLTCLCHHLEDCRIGCTRNDYALLSVNGLHSGFRKHQKVYLTDE